MSVSEWAQIRIATENCHPERSWFKRSENHALSRDLVLF